LTVNGIKNGKDLETPITECVTILSANVVMWCVSAKFIPLLLMAEERRGLNICPGLLQHAEEIRTSSN
jgi:hypothetical protein